MLLLLNPVAGPLSSEWALLSFAIGLVLEIAIILSVLRRYQFHAGRVAGVLVAVNLVTWVPLMLAFESSLGSTAVYFVVGVGEFIVVIIEFFALSLLAGTAVFRASSEPVPFPSPRILWAALLANLVSFGMGLAVFLTTMRVDDPGIDPARLQVSTLFSAVEKFEDIEDRLPNSFLEMIVPDVRGRVYLDQYTGEPIDPWGVPYQLRVDHTGGTFQIVCAGPDAKFDTADDITTKSWR